MLTNLLPSRRLRGAALIGLISVLIIIMAVLLWGPFKEDPQTQVTQYQQSTSRSKEVACMSNRNAINTNLTNWKILNPDVKIDAETIRRHVRIPQCPGGGVYLIGPQWEVYCTEHQPPPAHMLSEMIDLSPPPTPVPTQNPLIRTPPPTPAAAGPQGGTP